MIFKSATDLVIKITFGFIILLLLIVALFSISINNIFSTALAFIVNVTAIILLVWIYFRTEYKIENDILYCISGPIKKKISILEIVNISYHSGIIVPIALKLSLSSTGLIINYGKCDEIYISPEDTDLFLQKLKNINPNFIITSPKNA
ncbi:PH domain-containing protein [Flavobacterium sp. U410]